jgi:hypothetical protein
MAHEISETMQSFSRIPQALKENTVTLDYNVPMDC